MVKSWKSQPMAPAGRLNWRVAVLAVIVIDLLVQPALATPVNSTVKRPKNVAGQSAAPVSKPSHAAAVAPMADAPLGQAEMAIAERVEIGTVACELGASVTITANATSPGYFDVQGRKFRFHMAPVQTHTGAIRLEDAQAGAVWLQLPHKSMLMSQKLGSRLADACVTPSQALVADAMQKNPPPGLLDTPQATGAPAVTVSVRPAQGSVE